MPEEIENELEEEEVEDQEVDSEEEDVEDEQVEEESPVEEPEQPEAVQYEAADPDAQYEYDGFLVGEDGVSLYEPALEDPDSKEGEALRADLTESEYARLVGQYEAAKIRYENDALAYEVNEARQGVQNLQTQVTATTNTIKSQWLPGLKDEDYNKILSAAAQEIEAERQTRVQQYVNQGLTYQRALARTDRELTSVPDLFETAAAVSIVKGVQKGLYSITPKAAGKVKGKVGIAPIPTPPPIIAGAGGGGSDNVDTSPRIKATAYEVEVAKSMGIDPHKLALVRAQREGRA